jgi:hypothetical protein
LQKFLSRLFDRLMKSWSWVLLIILTILIKWVSLYPGFVERNYTYGIYPYISKLQRLLFGWLPFSIGDLFYAFLIMVIFFRAGKFFKYLFQRKLTRAYFAEALQQTIFIFLFVYVTFNLLWGLNYNRTGIAAQLSLDVQHYSEQELADLCVVLQVKLNKCAKEIDTSYRDKHYTHYNSLFHDAKQTYREGAVKFPFAAYTPASIKPSLVGFLGKFVGFQGYYNPFSGEGQVKTSIPIFLQPFVTCHEIAHQVGYAKENEANFVGFLVAKESSIPDFRYSAYYDVYNYAIREYYMMNFEKAKSLDSTLDTVVRADRHRYTAYLLKMKNAVAPVMLQMYDSYLRMNNQPKGYKTYNEVVTWLVGYMRKNGVEGL